MTSVQARLTEILPAAAAAVGSPLNGDVPWELPAAEAYVVALIDGMGEVLIREHPDETPFLSSLTGIPAISEIPSTTATSLTSFGCALPPTQHGVVGYTSRIPGTDRLLNALNWDKNLDPEEWQPLPTAFERLARAGIAASVVGPKDYESSGLTSVSQRGAAYLQADRFGERLAQTVRASQRGPSITYYYDSDLDWVGHRHGVDSAEWRAQLRLIDTSLEQLRAALPEHVKMLITADHGMVDTTRGRQLDVDSIPELRQGVDLIGGEARFRYLYCDPDLAPNVVRRWRSVVSDDDATILTFED
ncbi:MAG TPA: alkaline phosphatase family protein, partial [Marmoricola sp.]|nr:alkaline phosphatase family protein [Marmoricola sp.]